MKKLIKKVINKFINKIPKKKLKALIKKLFNLYIIKLDKDEKIKYLLEFDNYLYNLQGKASIEHGNGVHSKHRHMKYHDFFINNINKDEKVLDIGCGYGVLANAIATRSDCAKVYGIEIEPSHVEKAKKMFSHEKVDFILGDATTFDFKENFDVVALSNVLEHLTDRPEFLAKVKKHVNPKRFLIRVPMFERDWRVPLKQELGIEWRLDNTHELEYTTEIFEQEITQSGLKIESTIYKWGEVWAVVK